MMPYRHLRCNEGRTSILMKKHDTKTLGFGGREFRNRHVETSARTPPIHGQTLGQDALRELATTERGGDAHEANEFVAPCRLQVNSTSSH
ncbi:hypothetical protein TGPRC2_297065 [Toxoplasma gondii TgCatPRC2]|uniref:Uncharacterized protein n=6 Tax=Toxoplasma gondii TaxID=5811 RepID=A0A151HJ00_TOXGO|nr:hypothetical protein TGME49_297065 [Toxoplasma gondii ME49]KFH04591.1 hypothetical protein TGMAS_297065 [Toxoplasma gondii MAS]KYF42501.1 hypothetical protein TGARI_297065 [Toxoplasma gondii ARI]KYK69251.1 hypothetical protein TGPRC2_297065 [Toxoplasma gondii TgCatPRC2]PUA84677.1 hypothetical protein TGBR9_297065 [Toxoplasma gondii TgCATBr9]EPT32126.1 hypothetical protein TGME49_297065 [Toxoplasma gondii ME49]|eukprot:XP_018638342.1 hypothetical protein TGME49_297065 [Toxoplasma gondii ME49]